MGVARSAAIGTMFQVRGAVDGGGILLLKAIVHGGNTSTDDSSGCGNKSRTRR